MRLSFLIFTEIAKLSTREFNTLKVVNGLSTRSHNESAKHTYM